MISAEKLIYIMNSLLAKFTEKYRGNETSESFLVNHLTRRTIEVSVERNEAHLGGSLSLIPTLVALFHEFDPREHTIILSKSHASFPFIELLRLCGYEPNFKTHLEYDPKNGVEATTGSLGHGLPIAIGRAYAAKLKSLERRIVCIISDGECQEGTTWEAILCASHHKLDNLLVLIDRNGLQALGHTEDILSLEPLDAKFQAFGASVKKLVHPTVGNLRVALTAGTQNKPTVLIIEIPKGIGFAATEGKAEWHARRVTADIAASLLEKNEKNI